MKKIRLLAVDVDGCITGGEGKPVELDVLRGIRDVNERAKTDADVPEVTLCTGRQQPFVDLMCQIIGTMKPAIFENGAGLHVPETYSFIFHPSITPELRAAMARFKNLVHEEMVVGGTAKIQPGKEVSMSVYPEKGYTVADNEKQLRELVGRVGGGLVLDVSTMCINVLMPGINKGTGVRFLSGYAGVGLDEMGAVGDMPGDLHSIGAVAFGACPANAVEEVKAASDFVAPHENGRGVLAIIDEVIRRNRASGAV